MSRAWIKRYFYCDFCNKNWFSKEFQATSIICDDCNVILYEIEEKREYGGDGKLFGYFECVCGKWWESAYAFANSWQKCTECKREVYPEWMEELQYEGEPNLNKPHLSNLCQRCLSGHLCVYKEPESRKPKKKKTAKLTATPKPKPNVSSFPPQKTTLENPIIYKRRSSVNITTDYNVTYQKSYASVVKPKPTLTPKSLKPRKESVVKVRPITQSRNASNALSDFNVSQRRLRQQRTESTYRPVNEQRTKSIRTSNYYSSNHYPQNRSTHRLENSRATETRDEGSLFLPIIIGCAAVYAIYRFFQ